MMGKMNSKQYIAMLGTGNFWLISAIVSHLNCLCFKGACLLYHFYLFQLKWFVSFCYIVCLKFFFQTNCNHCTNFKFDQVIKNILAK